MKHLYYIAALAATFLTAMPLHAQEEAENDATQQQQTRRRSPQASRGERNDKKDTGLPELDRTGPRYERAFDAKRSGTLAGCVLSTGRWT